MNIQSLLSYFAFNNYESMKLNINTYNQSGKTLLYSAIFYLFVFLYSTFIMESERNEKNIDPYEYQTLQSNAENYVDMFRVEQENESNILFLIIIQ